MTQNPDKTLIDSLRKLIEQSDNSRNFLQKRNLFDPNDDNFAKNHNSKLLHNYAGAQFEADPPFVLYCCLPDTNLALDINSTKFKEWFADNKVITVESHNINVIPNTKKFDLDSITFNNNYNEKIDHYVEFLENGYVEQGYSFPLIYDYKKNLPPALDLGRTTSMLWAFLLLCKKYYEFAQIKTNFEILLVIRNSIDLSLTGFNGKLGDGRVWVDPYVKGGEFSKTDRKHIIIKKKLKSISELSDNYIKEMVRNFSDKVANCYNLEFSRSYNHDGSLNEENFYID